MAALGGLLALVLVVGAGLGALWWAAFSEPGSAWVLSRVPGLTVKDPRGALARDFEAGRVDYVLPGVGRLILEGLGWRGLQVSRTPHADPWLRVRIDELRARRVEWIAAADVPPRTEPLQPPATLRLPVEVEIVRLRVDTLHAAALGDRPLRDLRAGVHLGADAGARHEVDALSVAWGQLRAGGTVRVATGGDMALQIDAEAGQDAVGDLPAWNGRATLAGPLRAPSLQATLRAQPLAQRPPQSLDLQAGLRPFERWPLADLQARTEALDLSAFHSAAPTTALTGNAVVQSQGLDQPIAVQLQMDNARAGRWNDGQLPVRRLGVELHGRANDPGTLELRQLDAELGTQQQAAGRVQGGGQWTPDRWTVDATLTGVQPSMLDARAPAMQFSGPVRATGHQFGAADADLATLELQTDLAGQLSGAVLGTRVERGKPRNVQLKLDALLNPLRVELRNLQARSGDASATLAGQLTREKRGTAWRVVAKASVVEFDPSPWWPGPEDSPWRRGPHRLNAKGEADLTLPPEPGTRPLIEQLASLRGQASVALGDSVLAGVPLSGEASLNIEDTTRALPRLELDLAGNRISAQGELNLATGAGSAAAAGTGAGDRWDLSVAAPTLQRLEPLLKLLLPPGADSRLAGALNANVDINGRWPDITTKGELDATALRATALTVQRAQARWQVGNSLESAVDAHISLGQAAWGEPSVESLQVDLKGTGRSHRLEVRAESKARPPAWTDTLLADATARATTAAGAAAAGGADGATRAAPPAAAPATTDPKLSSGRSVTSMLVVQAQGGLVAAQADRVSGWRGQLGRIEWLAGATQAPAWVRGRDIGIDLQWADGPMRVRAEPGRVEMLGGALRWSRLNWQGSQPGTPGQIDVLAEIEPISVAPLLAKLQPGFGWGGDLQMAGRVELRSAPTFTADVVIERMGGDLTVTDETGTQALGLTDLRLALDARDGRWSFTQGLAGKTLGVGAGAVQVITSPQALWPTADAPVQGVLELQVANLGTWGTWVPAGWRLGGELRTSAAIGGRFGAPEYSGMVQGSNLSVRNFLQGVNVSDGDVLISLQATTARIERFKLKGGAGTLELQGDATLGEAPKAQLQLVAEGFQVLGRVDRRVVTSGRADLRLDRESLSLDGRFGIDEALIDFTRGDAPQLASDVVVKRPRPATDTPAETQAPPTRSAAARKVALDVRVGLGEKLRVRGRGVDTRLRGELHITSPGGRIAVNGTVNAVDGTYAAYGQKLAIERGNITFNGPVDNPRLDIEATRPDTDLRVGVAITGTTVNPRVRLFSEPEMSELDKLSWLLMGRASEGLGSADTALLQRAAVALLSGEGEGVTDQVIRSIGLDQLSLRQSDGTDGNVRETVVSLGKNLSRRWYVGYERGLNATAGTWQLIYRIAQRFTLRAQSGLDNSLDLIWTWRWN